MPRLPSTGSDHDKWGDVLNEYLQVAHNADGTPANVVANMAALRAMPPAHAASLMAVYVAGYYTPGHGGDGLFCWDATSTATDNGGTVIASSAGGTGRWIRQNNGRPVSIQGFGAKGDATTDDTVPIQTALDCAVATGLALHVPEGTYRLTSGLKFADDKYGNGLKLSGVNRAKSVFLLDANDQPVITIYYARVGGGRDYYTSHGHVKDIAFAGATGRTGIIGMQITACWYYTYENILVSSLHVGVEIYSNLASSDLDFCGLLTFRNVEAKMNMTNGFQVRSAPNSLPFGQSRLEYCDFSANGRHGIYLEGIDGVELYKCIQGVNGQRDPAGCNVVLGSNGSYSKNFVMRGCESNGAAHSQLQLYQAINVLLEQNRWLQNNGEGGIYTIEMLAGGTVMNLLDIHSYFVLGTEFSGIVAYYAIGATVKNTMIDRPHFSQFGASNIKYSFSSLEGVVIQENTVSKGQSAGWATASIASGTFAPDCFIAKYHRILLTAPGDYTIADPINADAGRELGLSILNSGGEINVSFGPKYQTNGFAVPPIHKRSTATFVCDHNGEWIQMGAWAIDI